MKVLTITTVAVCLLFTGCGPSAPTPLSEKDIAAIESIGTAFEAAVLAGEWDAVGMMYAEDAVLFPPNSDAVTGRAAISEYFSTFPPITRFEIRTVDIQGSGDIAVVHGTYVMTLQPPGMPPIEDHGKWLEMRKRQADGSWPYQWDMFNSSVPLPVVTP